MDQSNSGRSASARRATRTSSICPSRGKLLGEGDRDIAISVAEAALSAGTARSLMWNPLRGGEIKSFSPCVRRLTKVDDDSSLAAAPAAACCRGVRGPGDCRVILASHVSTDRLYRTVLSTMPTATKLVGVKAARIRFRVFPSLANSVRTAEVDWQSILATARAISSSGKALALLFSEPAYMSSGTALPPLDLAHSKTHPLYCRSSREPRREGICTAVRCKGG
jgi:hypothetical protein